jgi:pimeloyl-ACP methyl ester carboxylesterase
MRFMPGWNKMKDMAHTTTYDLAILEGVQDGKPLSSDRWAAAQLPTLILTGEKSEAFFHNGARTLAGILPQARHKILKGQHHGSVVTAPNVLANELLEFFRA